MRTTKLQHLFVFVAVAAFTMTATLAFPLNVRAEVISLEAHLDGSQEVPPVDTPGTGDAIIHFDTDTNMLSWEITFQDLQGETTAAHFHGPATPEENAFVTINIGRISGLQSPLIGQRGITNQQAEDLLAGLWYIAIHSTAHRLGEIRGQVNQVTSDLIFLEAHLEGSQEVPPTNSTGTGDATMIFDLTTNELSWEITFQGLSGPATGAHFHGPAPAGVNAGIQVDIGAISGLNSPMIGSAIISNAQATDLLAGLWYINIHTALFPGGEIRGQVNISP